MADKKVQGLTEMRIVPGRSMDEIDNESFRAGPRPIDSPAVDIALEAGAWEFPARAPALSLSGAWQMAEGGDERDRLQADWRDALPADVPGSVHAALFKAGCIPDQTVGRNQVTVRKESFKTWWFRRSFPRPAGQGPFRLLFHGVAIHCTVWLNGHRLGEHEGMFGGPVFDVTDLLADENTLVVKLDPAPMVPDPKAGPPADTNIGWRKTVVFNNVYGWHYSNLPALGIWRPVEVKSSAAAHLEAPFVITRDALRGEVDLVTGLGAPRPGQLIGQINAVNFEGQPYRFQHRVGGADIHVRFTVPDPHPWWPNGVGAPHLYRMQVAFLPDGGGVPDVHEFTFGLRSVEMAPLPDGPRPDKFNWTFVINGRPMFVKGTGWCTMDPLMDFSPERYARFLTLAADEHCQMVRAWGSGMPETDEFYDACDRLGLMVMQEWPTAWNSHEDQPYDVLEETVRLNTLRLRNRPSLVIYTGGNESSKPFGKAIDMMGRLAIELDGTRPFHRGEPWGGSQHEYPTYWGRRHPDAHLTSTADFYGEFGMASVPVYESVQRYLPEVEEASPHPTARSAGEGTVAEVSPARQRSEGQAVPAWPPPENGAFLYHVPVFNTRQCFDRLAMAAHYFVPRDADRSAPSPSMGEGQGGGERPIPPTPTLPHGGGRATAEMKRFIEGSQLAQVVVLRHQLERARTRWPNCTGALFYKLNDNFPAASWATVDWYGAPKLAHYFVQDAFAPLAAVVLFDSLNYFGTQLNNPVYLIDETDALDGAAWQVRVRVLDGGLNEVRCVTFAGQGSAGGLKRLGTLDVPWQETQTAPLLVVSDLARDGAGAFRTFYFLNYEFRRGCLFDLPRTRLRLRVNESLAVVENTGRLPAVAVRVDRPGHLDTFRIDDNYFWLDPGEARTLSVSEIDGLVASAFNADAAHPHEREGEII